MKVGYYVNSKGSFILVGDLIIPKDDPYPDRDIKIFVRTSIGLEFIIDANNSADDHVQIPDIKFHGKHPKIVVFYKDENEEKIVLEQSVPFTSNSKKVEKKLGAN